MCMAGTDGRTDTPIYKYIYIYSERTLTFHENENCKDILIEPIAA